MTMTLNNFLHAYCGNVVKLDLFDYTTNDSIGVNLCDEDIYDSNWGDAEVVDWEIVDGTMNLNVIRTEE